MAITVSAPNAGTTQQSPGTLGVYWIATQEDSDDVCWSVSLRRFGSNEGTIHAGWANGCAGYQLYSEGSDLFGSRFHIFFWTIPSGMSNSQYTVRVESVDSGNWDESDEFYIGEDTTVYPTEIIYFSDFGLLNTSVESEAGITVPSLTMTLSDSAGVSAIHFINRYVSDILNFSDTDPTATVESETGVTLPSLTMALSDLTITNPLRILADTLTISESALGVLHESAANITVSSPMALSDLTSVDADAFRLPTDTLTLSDTDPTATVESLTNLILSSLTLALSDLVVQGVGHAPIEPADTLAISDTDPTATVESTYVLGSQSFTMAISDLIAVPTIGMAPVDTLAISDTDPTATVDSAYVLGSQSFTMAISDLVAMISSRVRITTDTLTISDTDPAATVEPEASPILIGNAIPLYIADLIDLVIGQVRVPADTLAISDTDPTATVTVWNNIFFGTWFPLYIADLVTQAIGMSPIDTLTISDTDPAATVESEIDIALSSLTLALSDLVTQAINRGRFAIDTLAISDTATATADSLTYLLQHLHTLALSDLVTQTIDRLRLPTDTLTLSDTATATADSLTYLLEHLHTLALSDLASPTIGVFSVDTLAISDTDPTATVESLTNLILSSLTLALSDLTAVVIGQQSVTDTLAISDTDPAATVDSLTNLILSSLTLTLSDLAIPEIDVTVLNQADTLTISQTDPTTTVEADGDAITFPSDFSTFTDSLQVWKARFDTAGTFQNIDRTGYAFIFLNHESSSSNIKYSFNEKRLLSNGGVSKVFSIGKNKKSWKLSLINLTNEDVDSCHAFFNQAHPSWGSEKFTWIDHELTSRQVRIEDTDINMLNTTGDLSTINFLLAEV